MVDWRIDQVNLGVLTMLREWRRHPWQILLSLIGVAIGVAVIVAVDLANVSAEREFERANQVVDGLATHRVGGALGGIDEEIHTAIKVDLGIREAAPVVRGEVLIAGEAFTLLGIDPVSDYRLRGFRLYQGDVEAAPFPLFADAALSRRLGLDMGVAVTLAHGGHEREFVFSGILGGDEGAVLPEDMLITDIAAAQVFLRSGGRLSYIDLKLERDEDVAAVTAILPQQAHLVSTESRNRARFDMTRAFRINLTALGMLALVVGLFLIYNTVSFQVVRRRPLFGLLRAIGVTSNGVFGYLIAEAAIIAAIGVGLGVGLGILLSQSLYAMVTGTMDTLYFELSRGLVTLDPLTLFKAAGIGMGASLLAATIPALEARATPPRGLLVRSGQERAGKRQVLWVVFALGALAMAAALLWLLPDSLVAAFAALFLLILGVAALAPVVVVGLSIGLGGPAARLGMTGTAMAMRNARTHLSRTGLAASALTLAVAASLGVALMIDSFRTSVEDWLVNYLRADIYIGMGEHQGDAFSPDFIESLRRLEGVASVGLGRRLTVDDPVHGSLELFVVATSAEDFQSFQLKSGRPEGLWQRFSSAGEVLVSEPFANRFDLSPGDVFELATDRGRRALTIAGVYFDYSSDRGVLTMSPETFARSFDPRGYRAASLYLESGVDSGRVLAEFERSLNPDGQLFARSNRELRDLSLGIFDRTFEVTGILRLLAMVVAVTGIIAALMSLQLERTREYAMLRAIGFTRRQMGVQVLAETGLTGFASGLLAIPLGMLLSVLLIRVINVRSFGWSMQTVVDPGLLVQALWLAVASALIAGLYPALKFRSFDIAGGLKND
jgi:putative ABC transport system permease protein